MYHPQGVAGIHVEATAGHPGERVEVWFEDEARFGQKGSLTTVWAERGSRPTAPEQTAYQYSAGISQSYCWPRFATAVDFGFLKPFGTDFIGF